MSVRLHLLARWYEARAVRAQRKLDILKARAEHFWSRLKGGQA